MARTSTPIVIIVGCFAAAVTGLTPRALGQSPQTKAEAAAAVRKGVEYLLAAQESDGGWEAFGRSHPAISALALKCLLEDERVGPDHPAVKRGLRFLLTFVQPDGGIYQPEEAMANYHTSVAVMALSSSKDPAHAPILRKAQAFLTGLQWDDGEGYNPASAWYGGAGYGQHKRPDLSNTQMMLEALKQSGLPAEHPAYQKALAFVSRCQMLSSTNDQAFARGATGGGFVYTAANQGESKGGVVIVEGRPQLRSYGSMTYAGFKSMLYASLDRDDERVQTALAWIGQNYTLDQNPNMPEPQAMEGLYYYYHTFARALAAWGEETLTDADGRPRHWRDELCAKLVSLQKPDGSWSNEADLWYEGNPHLVTAYSVRALQTALRK